MDCPRKLSYLKDLIVCDVRSVRLCDLLVMSSDGPLGAYVNSHGYVLEVIIFRKANGLPLKGRPVKEYSWFPGCAWTIVNCASC
ncbi:protein cereblon-like isoform X2 [Durio zibethinus]|uniref:Protein cereblon-like isoform X2 n=1 Tax=Durio zibethinus TaxID=66656 RepID=A0A6P5ZNX8_DURZI|nr:protein cereblon-like isoform X2 [Durio zibethinus]